MFIWDLPLVLEARREAKELRHLSYSELLGPTSQASAGCQEGPLLLLPCSVVMS